DYLECQFEWDCTECIALAYARAFATRCSSCARSCRSPRVSEGDTLNSSLRGAQRASRLSRRRENGRERHQARFHITHPHQRLGQKVPPPAQILLVDPKAAPRTPHRPAAPDIDESRSNRGARYVYVRASQASKFETQSKETFRLTREAVKYLETYFDYKFPWP